MKIAERLGIYGGTFAPPHKGHVAMARAFIESGYIDKLLIMPTFLPPHKQMDQGDDPSLRLEMLNIAMKSLMADYPDRVIISDYEIAKGDVSYTYNTVKHFLKYCDELTIFCGSDMLLTLDTWYKADELLRMCSVAYNTRVKAGADIDKLSIKAEYLNKEYGTKMIPLGAQTVEISSSTLRDMIAKGENTDVFLDEKVRSFIDEHGLYRN
ncbi:MAG: nicotinate (nicotinamide) nucleotide adenylyltransferase [Clostridia bacterium]|nr:nicotinate (nicotinamide) nucleotide adenylyltransferase [Clostridia bacterium]